MSLLFIVVVRVIVVVVTAATIVVVAVVVDVRLGRTLISQKKRQPNETKGGLRRQARKHSGLRHGGDGAGPLTGAVLGRYGTVRFGAIGYGTVCYRTPWPNAADENYTGICDRSECVWPAGTVRYYMVQSVQYGTVRYRMLR